MVSVFVHRSGVTEQAPALDPSWLAPDGGVHVWVDLSAPTPEELRLLEEPFRFHPLAVEDAIAARHHPKIERYDGYLYLILHGIDFQASHHRFATHDTDFFLGPNYLVTIHDGQTRTVQQMREVCARNDQILGEGPVSLLHRIIDAMVDHYRPEVEKLEHKLEHLETKVFEEPDPENLRAILALKRDVSSLRRVTLPQRDAVSRLARREFTLVTDEMAYRFRDVLDNLVRLSDEALFFQDRIASLLDAHLANTSNRLNEVMKALTVITTVAVPFTVMGGLYGMNVKLPGVPGEGSPRVFWLILAGTLVFVFLMMLLLRRKRRL
jgi:magnesium transporter